MKDINLDEILFKLGDSGKFQRQYYSLLCCVVIFSVFHMSYIFTARDIKYRCYIPECKNDSLDHFNPNWLKYAVPYKDDTPNKCVRFASSAGDVDGATCTDFIQNKTMECQDFVFERPETTIVHDYNITCDENLWKLTIVGTINVVGQLFCLPFSGFLSDRFGRKTMMVSSVLFSSVIGTIRSLSVNYVMYVLFEFLDTALGSGMYSAAFILAMELVSPKSRKMGNTILSCAFALGQVLMGVVAWLSPSWRVMLRILYIPGILYISLWWLLPESVRWLLSRGKQEEAKEILRNLARINNKELTFESYETFTVPVNRAREENEKENEKTTFIKKETLVDSLRSVPLLLRLLQCSYLWICCTFVYYGLTIHSVSLSENIYMSFIYAVAIEIPAYILSYFIIDVVGRKKIICSSLLIGGISCVTIGYLPANVPVIGTALFLIGKFCMTLSYTVVYIYTTEMFPTSSRHTMFALCSMFGRFGSMVAPQVPLLTTISKSLPMIMFGIMAATSGILALTFPETLNTRLPDTVQDAVQIGKKKTPENSEVSSTCEEIDSRI